MSTHCSRSQKSAVSGSAAAALLVVLLACLPKTSAAKPDLDTDLLRAGFVAGVQDRGCLGPSYVAEIVNGDLKVSPADASAKTLGSREALRFSGKSIRYEAMEEGEFGGQLEAVMQSGERRVILKGNVRSLVPVKADLFVFEGLSHLSTATGSIYLVSDYDRAPSLTREPLTYLPDTPVFATLQTRNHDLRWFWVVGTHSLVSVITDWHVMQVHSWNEFHVDEVSSFLEDDRGVLIGTCGGVVAIEMHCGHAPRSATDNPCPARFYVPKRN